MIEKKTEKGTEKDDKKSVAPPTEVCYTPSVDISVSNDDSEATDMIKRYYPYDVPQKQLAGMKKTIVYTSERSKDVVEGALLWLSIENKKAPSAILEDLILKEICPSNPDAAAICMDLYSSRTNGIHALERIYSLYAGGIMSEAKYKNGLALVEYLESRIVRVSFPSDRKTEGERQYFLTNFNELFRLTEAHYKDYNRKDLAVFESKSKYIKYHLDLAVNEPANFTPINLVDFVLKEWSVFGNFTYTYRTLMSLCRIIAPQVEDSLDDRMKLIRILFEVSKEWD
ncbi:MAG: hypothetical protein J6N70_02570 [Oribacterium sp.]|nr:hypothetical protein [Oribacterium sp.]